ncbi:hypothetical protein NN561_012623 [Cricetulus griseus]
MGRKRSPGGRVRGELRGRVGARRTRHRLAGEPGWPMAGGKAAAAEPRRPVQRTLQPAGQARSPDPHLGPCHLRAWTCAPGSESLGRPGRSGRKLCLKFPAAAAGSRRCAGLSTPVAAGMGFGCLAAPAAISGTRGIAGVLPKPDLPAAPCPARWATSAGPRGCAATL